MQDFAARAITAFLATILTVVGAALLLAVALVSTALFAVLTMAFWAVLIGALGWLMPGTMEMIRIAVGLSAYEFWEIGAGLGLVFYLLRLGVGHVQK